jgi:hypothetical protein
MAPFTRMAHPLVPSTAIEPACSPSSIFLR